MPRHEAAGGCEPAGRAGGRVGPALADAVHRPQLRPRLVQPPLARARAARRDRSRRPADVLHPHRRAGHLLSAVRLLRRDAVRAGRLPVVPARRRAGGRLRRDVRGGVRDGLRRVVGVGGPGGWGWLGRQAGLGGWVAHAPALIYVTAAYVLTNAYARGTWPELVATSAIPLVIAGGWWLLRAPRWRAGPVAAWVIAVVLFTGSHNLTLAWG